MPSKPVIAQKGFSVPIQLGQDSSKEKTLKSINPQIIPSSLPLRKPQPLNEEIAVAHCHWLDHRPYLVSTIFRCLMCSCSSTYHCSIHRFMELLPQPKYRSLPSPQRHSSMLHLCMCTSFLWVWSHAWGGVGSLYGRGHDSRRYAPFPGSLVHVL